MLLGSPSCGIATTQYFRRDRLHNVTWQSKQLTVNVILMLGIEAFDGTIDSLYIHVTNKKKEFVFRNVRILQTICLLHNFQDVHIPIIRY
jgi:hypothetical protein